MTSFRLSPRAKRSLVSIFVWTVGKSGSLQAEPYRDALIDRCRSLAAGRPPDSRPCSTPMKESEASAEPYDYREGSHYIVYCEVKDGIVIVDSILGAAMFRRCSKTSHAAIAEERGWKRPHITFR